MKAAFGRIKRVPSMLTDSCSQKSWLAAKKDIWFWVNWLFYYTSSQLLQNSIGDTSEAGDNLGILSEFEELY